MNLRRFVVLPLCLSAAVLSCSRERAVVAEGHPSFRNAPVIVISIDTLRADRLPAYGYREVETPNIDALRRDGVLFERAYAHVPLTLPSHVALLTGQLPPQNGVRNNLGFQFDASKHMTISRLLKEHGYATGAAVSAYVLRAATGLGDVFDDYDDAVNIRGGESVGAQQRPGTETAAIATKWIADHQGSPFFYLFHIFEPHAPYSAPEPHRSRWKNPYDAEIAASDEIVGRFLDGLKASGIYDDAIIILLSDHGEGLGDHGEDEHGVFLYREAIHVPLIVKLPKNTRRGGTVTRVVSLIDVFPTVVRLAGIDPPSGLPGISLFDAAPATPRHAYAESLYPRIHLGWSDTRSLVDEDYQYIESPKPELYDLAKDPRQQKNILSDERRVYAAMRKELDLVPRGEATTANIDPEEARKLAALGYLGGPAASGSGPLPDPKDHIGELQSFKRASMLVHEKRLNEAIAILRDLVQKNPKLTDAWTLLGRTYQDAGRVTDAIATYKRSMELSPQLAPDVGLTVAALLLTANQLDDAEAHARLGEKSNPGMMHLMIGRVALAREQYEPALQHATAAMRAHPYRVQAQVLAAQVFARTGQLDRAMQMIQQADADIAQRQLGPVSLLEYTRGDILARQNRFDEAIAAFEKELSLFPDDREAYASLAVVHWLRGEKDAARKTMERLVRAFPSAESRAFAAKTFRELGDERVAKSFERGR
ncbi:MAG: sulfatase-like hydrolase/transferase [Thermoanaerobaculia bacterium]